MITKRSARPEDAVALTTIALRSKAHWGYSNEFMQACKNELTVTPQACSSGLVMTIEQDGVMAGFYQLAGQPPKGKLDALFVDPPAIGKGIGGALFQEAVRHARRLGFTSLSIHSDPHAEAFYLHMGAKRVGESPSTSIPGRTLPILEIDL